MAFQRLPHETQRRGFVAFSGYVAFEDFAFVIDRTPEIEVPLPVPEAAHSAHQLAANIGRKQWPEPVPPESNCFMTYVDPAFEQQILHIP